MQRKNLSTQNIDDMNIKMFGEAFGSSLSYTQLSNPH